jgi:hypothetical protein
MRRSNRPSSGSPPAARSSWGSSGALGLFVFYLIISIIFGILAAVALAAGLLPTLPQLLQGF